MDKQIALCFVKSLKNYSHIPFLMKKINGEYRIIIFGRFSFHSGKCQTQKELEQSYLYYYTTISLLLCDVIIDLFEEKIVLYFLQKHFSNLPPKQIQTIKNISSLILDVNFPSPHSKTFYLYKKNLILGQLLLHFKNHNYLNIEAAALFLLTDYHQFIEKVLLASFQIISLNHFEEDFMIFILNNFLK